MATTLHVLSRSPFNDGRLGSCLYLLNPGDGLLLCGDAVHALLAGSHACQALELMPAEIELFALLEDLQARGIEDVPARLVAVDYPGFVELDAVQAQRSDFQPFDNDFIDPNRVEEFRADNGQFLAAIALDFELIVGARF